MLHSALKTLSVMLAGSALLAACGGGSSGTTSPASGSSTSNQTNSTQSGSNTTGSQNNHIVAFPTTVISSVFDGTNNSGQPLTTLLQSDGSYFIVYSDSTSGKASGVLLGTGTLNNGSFSSTNGLDLSLLGIGTQVTNAFGLSASYSEKKSFNGNATYAADNKTVSFTGVYNSTYEKLPDLAAFAGVYKVSVATKDLREDNIVLTISTDGKLTGQLSCGCSITTQLKVSADGTAYDATLDFQHGDNPLTGRSFSGNVYLDAMNKRLYIVGKMTDTGAGAVFVGTRS